MSTLKLSTLSNLAGSQSTAVENAINGSAKAWVNFNGTGTVAIRASYNVSSITDNGTGNYTVNFTNAMPDANYATAISSSNIASTAGSTSYFSASSLQINSSYAVSTNGALGNYDDASIRVAIFR